MGWYSNIRWPFFVYRMGLGLYCWPRASFKIFYFQRLDLAWVEFLYTPSYKFINLCLIYIYPVGLKAKVLYVKRYSLTSPLNILTILHNTISHLFSLYVIENYTLFAYKKIRPRKNVYKGDGSTVATCYRHFQHAFSMPRFYSFFCRFSIQELFKRERNKESGRKIVRSHPFLIVVGSPEVKSFWVLHRFPKTWCPPKRGWRRV